MRRLSLRGSAWGKRKGHTARNASDRQTADLLLMAKLCGAVTRSYTSRAVMSRRRRKRQKRSRTKLTRHRERPNTAKTEMRSCSCRFSDRHYGAYDRQTQIKSRCE